MFKRKTVLYVRYLDLPQDVHNELSDWHLFGNDRLLELHSSYRLGTGKQIPANIFQESSFQTLYQSVKDDGEFTGTFDEFLTEYKLRTMYWVACQKPDLKGIDEVLLDASW